jgi:hypothetical protein
MSHYAVTFRIEYETVGGKSYQERYDSLINNLQAKRMGQWNEPTSFWMVESDETTYDFTRRIAKGLSPEKDMVFAFDPEDMSAGYFGNVEAVNVLTSFFPSARKVA